MIINLKWLAQSTIYRDSIDLLAVIGENDSDRQVALPVDLMIKRLGPAECIGGPTLALAPQSARSLMQALWDAGIRPNNGDGSGAEAKALRDHIKLAERMADGLLARVPVNGEGGRNAD